LLSCDSQATGSPLRNLARLLLEEREDNSSTSLMGAAGQAKHLELGVGVQTSYLGAAVS